MTSNSNSDESKLETSTDAAPPSDVIESEDESEDEDADEDEEKDEKKAKKDKKKDKSKKVEIEYEAEMPRDEAVSYFEALVAGLRSGHLEFRQGDRVLVLAPADRLEIEVTAQQKGDKGKVVFEIEWSSSNRPLAIVTEAAAKADESATESDSDD